MATLDRETPTCEGCGSNVRLRGIIQILSLELFGRSLCISEFPIRRDIVGLGISDWEGYADGLARKFNYTNTYYHQEPKLDLRAVDEERVPYSKEGETREHFAQLHDYQLIERDGNHVLRNVTRDGVEQIFDHLVFHGGIGATLEMRLFSESSLLREFEQAGFGRVKIYKTPDFDHGIYWQFDWSLPLSARI